MDPMFIHRKEITAGNNVRLPGITERLKRVIAICLLLLSACASRRVSVPPPPTLAKSVEVIVESDLPAQQKVEALRELLNTVERLYQAELLRASERGKRYYEVVLQVLAAAIAGWGTWTVAHSK